MGAAKTDIWMPIYIGDYLADTGHLSGAQHGCYLLWMMHYWRKGALPNDIPALILLGRIDSPDAPSIAQAMLNEFFFLADDSMWHQKRLDAELGAAAANKLKSKEKAQKAANSRWNKHASSNAPSNAPSNAQAMLEECPSPSPLPKERTKATPVAKAPAFELPPWLPLDAWAGWLEARKRMRAPNTDRALKTILRELENLRASGHDPGAVLDQSTSRGWRGVFELKQSGAQYPNGSSHGESSEATRRVNNGRRVLARIAVERGLVNPFGADGGDAGAMAGAGPGGGGGGVFQGLREAGPEVLPPERAPGG